MDSTLLIFGAGGHGKVVLDAALRSGERIDFLLDDAPKPDFEPGRKVILASEFQWAQIGEFRFIVAIGEDSARKQIYQDLLRRGGSPASVIHPSVIISSIASIGPGTVICAGAIVNPGADIRENCIINTAASVDHDCCVGPHSHICPGVRLAGGVSVGSTTMIGTGAIVIPGIRIGSNCIVGAGSVVTRDVPDGAKVYGNPARSPKLKS